MKSSPALYGQQTSPMNAVIDQPAAQEASMVEESVSFAVGRMRRMSRERCGKRQVETY